MVVTLQGEAKIRRVGNGLCLPLPTKNVKAEGFKAGSTVRYIIMRPGGINPAAFGSAHKYLKDVDLQKLMDEDRGPSED